MNRTRGSSQAAVPAEATLTILVGLMFMLQPLSTDLYLASLPGLVSRFEVPASTVQLTLSVFVAGFGLMQLVSGPMSDRYGRRPVVLGGLALYIGATLACAAAPSMAVLIGARFVQAVGCCTVVVVARAIVRDAFDVAAGVRALARASTILAIGPIAGPIVGSMLEVAYGFRAAFVVQSALAAALCAITLRVLPETLAHPDARALKPGPLLRGYCTMLRSPVFRAYALAGAFSYGGLFAFISGSSFVLIRVLHVPASWFGACFALVIVGFLAGTIVCRRVLPSRGLVRTLALGGAIAAASGVVGAALAIMGVRHVAAVLLPAFGCLFAHGFVMPCAQVGATSSFPDRAGAASGLFGAIMMAAATAVGTWIGASHDGTPVPLMVTMATAALIVLGAASLPALRRVPPSTSVTR
jgi:DHA1 family bicyclomycin/chloramphenicol resistance-like MFS transporter